MPGGGNKWPPACSAVLIRCTESPGRATKNRSGPIAAPADGASVHVGPTVSRRSAGTNTRSAPDASTNRNGFSRITGVLGSVVYGGGLNGVSPEDGGGAPITPATT